MSASCLVASEGFSYKSEAHVAIALLGKEMLKLQRKSQGLDPGSYGQPLETMISCIQRSLSLLQLQSWSFLRDPPALPNDYNLLRSMRSFSQASVTQTVSSGVCSKIPTAFRLWLKTRNIECLEKSNYSYSPMEMSWFWVRACLKLKSVSQIPTLYCIEIPSQPWAVLVFWHVCTKHISGWKCMLANLALLPPEKEYKQNPLVLLWACLFPSGNRKGNSRRAKGWYLCCKTGDEVLGGRAQQLSRF